MTIKRKNIQQRFSKRTRESIKQRWEVGTSINKDSRIHLEILISLKLQNNQGICSWERGKTWRRITSPTYSMTKSSVSIGSRATKPQSWILLRWNLSCFFRACHQALPRSDSLTTNRMSKPSNMQAAHITGKMTPPICNFCSKLNASTKGNLECNSCFGTIWSTICNWFHPKAQSLEIF